MVIIAAWLICTTRLAFLILGERYIAYARGVSEAVGLFGYRVRVGLVGSRLRAMCGA